MTYYLQDNPNPNFAQFGWKRTRVSGAIGVHTAENNTDFDGADPGAEDVARYIGRRTDPGSYHAIADADSRIKLIHPRYSAWADTTNNAHAMSVSGAMQAARWRELTPEHAAAITRNMAYAAAELVQDALAAGLLASAPPARRITPAEAVAGSKAGFYGHGETNPGRRYDPGQNFDWTLFLQTYASALGGIAAQGTITPTVQEDVVAFTADQETFIIKSLESLVNNVATKKDLATPGQVKFTEDALRSLVENVATKADLAGVSAAVASAVGAEASVADIEAAVRAGMSAGLKVDVTVS